MFAEEKTCNVRSRNLHLFNSFSFCFNRKTTDRSMCLVSHSLQMVMSSQEIQMALFAFGQKVTLCCKTKTKTKLIPSDDSEQMQMKQNHATGAKRGKHNWFCSWLVKKAASLFWLVRALMHAFLTDRFSWVKQKQNKSKYTSNGHLKI